MAGVAPTPASGTTAQRAGRVARLVHACALLRVTASARASWLLLRSRGRVPTCKRQRSFKSRKAVAGASTSSEPWAFAARIEHSALALRILLHHAAWHHAGSVLRQLA